MEKSPSEKLNLSELTTGAPKAPAKELHRRPSSCYFAKVKAGVSDFHWTIQFVSTAHALKKLFY